MTSSGADISMATSAFVGERAYLTNLAFRLLGDVGAAEDAVQEAFVRLLRAPAGSVEDARGWLIVVTGRLCLDQLRSARVRRTADRPIVDDGTTRSYASSSPIPDPADRVTLDDEVRRALILVLDRLSPAERVVFVLHDVFRVPFASIADTVGRPEGTCRQLATRARRRLAQEAPGLDRAVDAPRGRSTVDPATTAAITDAFIDACASGDAERLISLLDPSVSGDGDFGPGVPAPLVHGPDAVARRTIAFLGHGATVVTHPASARPTLLAYVDHELLAAIELTVDGGRIVELHADGRPERLAAVAAELRAAYR